MSNPLTIYRLTVKLFDPTLDYYGFVSIHDMDNLTSEDSTIVDITGAENSIELSIIDNDENPFTVIKSQQLTIRVLNSQDFNMNTLLSGTDNRWYVEYKIGPDVESAQIVFKGYLNITDISEPFMPYGYELVLTATDNLGILKDIPLVNADGDNAQGFHKISDYLTWALRKTGLELNLYCIFNIKLVGDNDDIQSASGSTEHLFYNLYLDAKTFEDEIGTSINCYEAIERILGHEACLFQRNGNWWILRRDEMEGRAYYYVSEYDSSGSLLGNLGATYLNKGIEKPSGDIATDDIFFSMEASLVRNERPNKSVRLNYNYVLPAELPCNTDFSRGDLSATISSTEKHYDIDCWTLYEDRPATTPSANSTAYIVRMFNANGGEISRYAEIGACTPSAVEQLLISEEIPIDEGDKFDFQVDVSWSGQTETGGSNYNYETVQIWLIADDGTYYTLHGGDSDAATVPVWVACTSSFNTNQKFFHVLFNGNDDDTEWKTVTYMYGPPPPCPKDGVIKIVLCHKNNVTSNAIRFQNLKWDYTPKINGSYRAYTGQYHKTSQDNYNTKYEEEVFISDSPKRIFKGALHIFDGSNYVLPGLFYNAAVFPVGPPDSSYHHPYGEIQLFDVWNQYNRNFRLFEATCQGIGLDDYTKIISPVFRHQFLDTSLHTNNKVFALLTMNRDDRKAEWTGTFRECFDSTTEKDYSNHEFKYIENG